LAETRFKAPEASSGTSSFTLPRDLLVQATQRLRVLTLLFAFTFFMANFFPSFLQMREGQPAFTRPLWWLPGGLSILTALAVFALTWKRGLDPGRLMTFGLLFGVVGCYGIAAAEFWGIYSEVPLDPENVGFFGLSWVAVWMLFFIMVIPSQPRRSLVAALGSSAAPAVTVLLSMHYGGSRLNISPGMLVIALVLPYLLCAVLAYAGARVVYKLGAEVRKARELGSYQLEERLGAGGMGEVWKAKHKMLARPSAVKLIRPEFLGEATPERRAMIHTRFEREAKATASMRSPHTIGVYDYGVAEDGTFYYVMELLEGLDLETFGKRFGPMPPERVIHVLNQVCHSLAEAHDVGLIHRDIKPANIFLCKYGRELDFVKVLDFGLVKAGLSSGQTGPMVTGEQILTGTPAFMAPEQVRGTGSVDARSDLYSLGCVGYWLLTGALVFEGETSLHTMTMHLEKEAVLPSERAETKIPDELERAIMMCLEKDPEHRPSSAEHLSALLSLCPVERPWTPESAARWWGLNLPHLGSPIHMGAENPTQTV